MSTLIVQIPSRPRLHAHPAGAGASDEGRRLSDLVYVKTADGIDVETHGVAAPALLPRATTTVAVVHDNDVSWHRITLPKAPANRMRAALVGVLEDALLDDAETVHLALAPNATAGQPTWIAAVNRAWLQTELALLQRANVFVDRVVPMVWPDDPPSGHFDVTADQGRDTRSASLTWAHADGVSSVGLEGGLARAILPDPVPVATRWTAAPGAATAAEQWLGAPVNVMPGEQRLLQAGRSLWNLLQYDLARRNRGSRALRDSLRGLLSPAWRPVRVGVGLLVLAQIVGLNVWAWHQRNVLETKRVAVTKLVKETFPRVNEQDIQRDAAAVLLRETQSLRAIAGKPGDTDLEPMLLAAASAWPNDRPPVENVRFEPGRLTLAATGWTDAQIEQFRNYLRPAGWQVEATEGRITLSRAKSAGAT